MISYEKAKEQVLNKYPDSKIVGAFKISTGFIFSLKPKSWGKDEYVLDGMFKVSNEGKMTEYSPVMDPEEFKEALKNPL